MEALNPEILNPGPILKDLRQQLQAFDVSQELYLRSSSQSNRSDLSAVANRPNPLGIREAVLPEIFQLMGIRSLTLNTDHDIKPLVILGKQIPENDQDKRQFLISDSVIQVLQPYLNDCHTIAFHDWANLAGASDLWVSLLRDVIKPIKKQSLEFIFYLGDPLTKGTFQVEEAIDIISNFSQSGLVTLALDEKEATSLWMVLNGVHDAGILEKLTFHDQKRKYISIFRTIGIDRLLIYSYTNAMLFTKQAQLVLARRKLVPSFELAPEARDYFIEGFSFGLLRKLDIVRCLALGLIFFGARSEFEADLDNQGLIAYIDQWLGDLHEPETIFLYQ